MTVYTGKDNESDGWLPQASTSAPRSGRVQLQLLLTIPLCRLDAIVENHVAYALVVSADI